MSGTKLVPILGQHNDIYIAGGAVTKLYRHEEATPPPAGAEEELVLCAAACYKITTPPPPPDAKESESVQPVKPKEGDAEDDDGESMLRAAQLEATKKRKRHTHNHQPPVVNWRLPLSRVLRVYPLSEWFRSAAKSEGGGKVGAEGSNAGALPEFGLVMEYVSEKPQAKVLKKVHPLLQAQVGLVNDKVFQLPQIRYRFFACKAAIEEQEWVNVFTAAICNYWHERLERNVIPDPELFQFQTFASAAPGELVHVVVSTSALIMIPVAKPPRSSGTSGLGAPPPPIAGLDDDQGPTVRQQVDVKGIKSCILVQGKVTTLRVLMSPSAASSAIAERGLCFFTAAAAMELAVELQRIWNLGRKDQTPFPFDTVQG